MLLKVLSNLFHKKLNINLNSIRVHFETHIPIHFSIISFFEIALPLFLNSRIKNKIFFNCQINKCITLTAFYPNLQTGCRHSSEPPSPIFFREFYKNIIIYGQTIKLKRFHNIIICPNSEGFYFILNFTLIIEINISFWSTNLPLYLSTTSASLLLGLRCNL